jgi:hypothetical protein
MCKLIIVASIAFIASCAHAPAQAPSDSIVGLWQFPNRYVWILINRDGSTLQCRLATDETAIVSKGTFVAPSSIVWEEIWGTDQVTAGSGSIVLRGQWGSFEYVPATAPLGSYCRRKVRS